MTLRMEQHPLLDLDSLSMFPKPHVEKPLPVHYGVCCGAWGDVILDLAEFRQTVREGGVILLTKDASLEEFVRHQTFVRDVIRVKITGAFDFQDLYDYACTTWPEDDPFPVRFIVERTRISPEKTLQCQLRPGRQFLKPWKGAILPKSSYRFAQTFFDAYLPDNQRVYLLHPFSFNSCGLEEHWRHWQSALDYLTTYTPYTYILTGRGWCPKGDHPRIINAVDKCGSMSDVFALAEKCAGVITTSNSMSHYAVIQNLRAVVCCNIFQTPYESPFRQFLVTEPDHIHMVYFEDQMDTFIKVVNRIL